MEMDLDQDIRAPSMAELDLYCDRVAGAVGRLSVKVFAWRRSRAWPSPSRSAARWQLTNILRDVDEDAGIGRLYLPREPLEAAGITSSDPDAVIADPRVDIACKAVAKVARDYYRQADAVLAKRPAGKLAAPRLMSAVYANILTKMEAAGWAAPRERAKIGKAPCSGSCCRAA